MSDQPKQPAGGPKPSPPQGQESNAPAGEGCGSKCPVPGCGLTCYQSNPAHGSDHVCRNGHNWA